jgi:hypothetical protein
MTTPVPAQPSVYHITHIDNLAAIVAASCLFSDAVMVAGRIGATSIGMFSIKERRLRLPVPCHPGDFVGEYVPFYFCPRSVMLFVISRRNNADLAYQGGQETIVHLVADMHEVIAWADACGRRWAFSKSNAGAYYTGFFASPADLHEVDWAAVRSTDFRDAATRDGKQAEFLVHESFPWELVSSIGVHSAAMKARVEAVIAQASHRPSVVIQRGWYY